MEASNDWELAKENFQPLKQGRGPQLLIEAVQAPTPEKLSIETRKRQFWAEIEAYDGPDPLEPWIRFIKWTQETFVAGGRQAELLPLLERCTRAMIEVHGYDDDIRYLRIWLQYADCLPQPQDVFGYLMENEIGQNHALFYMAYAAFMELRGNFGKAEAIFEMGLERMANPIHKLRAKHKEFQERMERRKVREAQEGPMPASKRMESQRTVLGVLKGKSKPTHASGLTRPPQSTTGVIAPRRGATVRHSDKENSAAELSIYTDDRFKDDAEPSRPDYNLASRTTSGGWKQLADFEATRKENERQTSRGRGSKLKQNKHLMPALDPELEIPEDEDLQQDPVEHREVAKGTLRQRLESTAARPIEESLMHDPLKLIKNGDRREIADASVAAKPSDKTRRSAVSTSKPNFSTFRAGHTGPLMGSHANDVTETTFGIGRLSKDRMDISRLPEITLNTREAFDQVNEMFKGALPKDFLWQSNEPTTTIRFGDATCNVTMSTKAAYDTINNMFGASSIQGMQMGGRPTSAKSGGDQTGSLEVYEDTSFLVRPTVPGPKEEATSSFQVYEDTDFIPAGSRSQGKAEQTEGFAVYEDTECLTGQTGGGRHRNLKDRSSKIGPSKFDELSIGSEKYKGSAAGRRSDDTDSFFVFEDENL